jgi:hypothetical protein
MVDLTARQYKYFQPIFIQQQQENEQQQGTSNRRDAINSVVVSNIWYASDSSGANSSKDVTLQERQQ